MSEDSLPGSGSFQIRGGAGRAGVENGGRPPGFIAIASATDQAAPEAMDRLRRAGITAYLEGAYPQSAHPRLAPDGVLYVAQADAQDAKTVLATLDEGIGPARSTTDLGEPHSGETRADAHAEDERVDGPRTVGDLDELNVDDVFAALMAGLDWDAAPAAPDAPAERPGATRQADAQTEQTEETDDVDDVGAEVSRRLREEQYSDPPELREEHYEPPPPPPVPRPGPAALVAVALILAGIFVMGFGTAVGMAPDQTLPVGIIIVLAGGALLAARLKRHHDDEDDGAVL